MARKYSDEFKKQIVGLYNSGKPAKEIRLEYDLHPSVLYQWIKRFNQSGSFEIKDNRSEEEQRLIQLEKENKQ